MFTLCGCCCHPPGHEALVYQSQPGLGGELTCSPRSLDQPTPPLMTAILTSDLTPARQRTITGPVGQRPLPRVAPKIPSDTTATARSRTGPAQPRGLLPDGRVTAFRAGQPRPGLGVLQPAAG